MSNLPATVTTTSAINASTASKKKRINENKRISGYNQKRYINVVHYYNIVLYTYTEVSFNVTQYFCNKTPTGYTLFKLPISDTSTHGP